MKKSGDMENKLRKASLEYATKLIQIYGEDEFHLSQEQIDNFIKNKVHFVAECTFPEMVAREQLYYVANKGATYNDYFEYERHH